MNKPKIIFLAVLFMILVSRAYAYDDGDFQVWNTDIEEVKLNKDLKFALEEEFRWGDNASEFFYQHYDAGIFYNLNKWLNVGGGYRQVYELKSAKFKEENEPYLTATLSYQKQWVFESRNRLEYRHFDYQVDSWRYRNKFTLKFPWKFTRIEVQPYLADEVLVNFGSGTNQLSQNRFSSGMGTNLTKNLKAEIYYMLVSTKGTDTWTQANVLGAKLKLSF